MTTTRGRVSTHRREIALVAAVAVVTSLGSAFTRPAAALAVQANDTLQSGAGYGFGRNNFGQVKPGTTANQLGALQLPSAGSGLLTDAVSVAAGTGFVAWVDHLGKVWSLGDNGSGQKGNGTTGGTSPVPAQASGFGGSGQPKAVKVTAFGLAVDVLDGNGDVWQWGQVVNNNSSLAIQSSPSKLTFPFPSPNPPSAGGAAYRIVDVVAGSNFSLALDNYGKVYSWGKNDRGQLGTGTTNTSPYPTAVQQGQTKLPATPLPSGQQATIEAGRDFSVYTVSGSNGVQVYTWGRGDLSQLGNGKTADAKSPSQASCFPVDTAGRCQSAQLKVLSVSSGTSHTLLLTNDGVVRTWGNNGLATSTTPTTVSSGLISGLHHPDTVAAGDGASFVTNTDGTVVSWGIDTTGQLGRTVTGTVPSPALISLPTMPPTLTGKVAQLVSRNGTTYAIVNAEIARSADAGYAFPATPVVLAPSQSYPTKAFSLKNVANRPLTVTQALYVDGAHPADFVLSANTCTAGTLALDATCSVTVTFKPSAAGARQASLVLRTSNTRGGVLLSSFVPMTGSAYNSVAGIAGYRLDVAPNTPTTLDGRGNRLPLSQLSPDLIPERIITAGSTATGKIATGKIATGKIATGKIATGKIATGKIATGKIATGKIALSTIGLPSLATIATGKIDLGSIATGKIPLLSQGGWLTFISCYPEIANVPVSSLTLGQVFAQPANATCAAPGDRLGLGDVDLRHSILAQASWAAVLMGRTRLSQYSGIDWCQQLASFPSASCTGDGLRRSLLGLNLLDLVPMDEMEALDLTIGELVTDADSAPGSSPLAESAWPQVLLSAVQLPGTRIGHIALASLPDIGAVLDCTKTSCTNLAGRTLGDLDVVSAIKPDAVFADLGSALDPIKIGWLVEPFLDRGSFPWEQLPRELIPLQAYPNRITLVTDVDVNCLQVSNTRVRLSLKPGYAFVPGTAVISRTRGSGTVALPDPADPTASALEFPVPDSAFSSSGYLDCTNDSAHLTVSVGVLPPDGASTDVKATGSVVTGALSAGGTQLTGVSTTGVYDPPSTNPSSSGRVLADELVLGEISARDQIKYLAVDVPPAKSLEVTLSQLSGDLDLVLYHPVGATPDPILSGTALPVPFGESGISDGTPGDAPDSALGGATQDVPIRSDRLVAAVSALRVLDDEQLSTVTRPGSQGNTYLVQVSGFNGATGEFTARIRVTDPESLGACTITPPPLPASPSSAFYKQGPDGSTGFRGDDDTVVLVNTARLRQYYPAQADAVLAAAWAFTHAGTGVKGQVLQVDADPAVRASMVAQDDVGTNPDAPCDPDLANAVGRATAAFEFSQLPAGVKNVVLLGGQELFTHLFPIDTTRMGNEREGAGDLALTGANLLAKAFAGGRYAIDTPYGTRTPIIVLGQVVYAPQLSVGRVGATPSQIIAQLSNFVTNEGLADTGSTRSLLATDYDFLTDGGTQAVDALKDGYASFNHDLTGKEATWTRSDLDQRWLNRPEGVPTLAMLNMHYDQYRALPALASATNASTDLYTAEQVASASVGLDRRVVLTVGCHSALDVPDQWAEMPGDERVGDWAQEYAGKNLAVMVGNLGFGFADSNVVAYSPKQQVLMAKNIAAGMDLGAALAKAQRDYVRGMVSVSPYDLKSMQQMVLWGVPNYRTAAAGAAQAASAQVVSAQSVPPMTTDPATGLPSRTVEVGTSAEPLQLRSVDDGGSSHLEARTSSAGEWGAAAVSGHPILPSVSAPIPNADDPSLTVYSAVPVGMVSTADERGVVSTFARAGTDRGLPQDAGNSGDFPALPGHVWTVPGDETESNLVVTPAQVHLRETTDADAVAPPGYSDRYRVTASQWRVLYGPRGAPITPDTIRGVDAVLVPGSGGRPTVTSYTIRVTPAAGAETVQVYVLSRPVGGAGAWRMTPLQLVGDSWVGGEAEARGAFYVVATNDKGFSAVSTLSGAGWRPHLVTNGGDFSGITISPSAGENEWRTTQTTATCAEGWTLYVDGAPVPCPYTFTDGAHVVTARAPDGTFVSVGGSKAFLTVLVDTIVPAAQLAFPGSPPSFPTDGNRLHVDLRAAQPVEVSTTCGPSGCTVTDDGVALGDGRGLRTSTVGPQSFTATVTNGAGVTATASQPYRVVFGAGSRFVNSGTGVVVLPFLAAKFVYRLNAADGANAGSGFASGSAAAFSSGTACSSGDAFTLPSGRSAGAEPVYNAATGNYEWDLSASTLTGCQQLDIALPDGWTHLTMPVQVGPF